MSTTHPEQFLLPGQAAAPAGPCDMTGMYVMHHAFRRDLGRFVSAVACTPPADSGTWRALAKRWSLFAHELHEHHTKEDNGIWPLLLERVDDADRDVLVAMEAEHAQIDPLLRQVEVGLARLAAGTSGVDHATTRAALLGAVTDLHGALDRHLAHEEADAIRIIQARIDAEEWEHLEATVLRGKPSPGQMLFMLPWVSDELPTAAFDRLFGAAPAPVRWLHRLGRRRYRRLDARAFVHA